MDGSGEGGGLNFSIVDKFWARLYVDVTESVFVGLGLERIWGDARAAIYGRGSRVVGGPLLSGGSGETLGPWLLLLDSGFSATIGRFPAFGPAGTGFT